MSWRARTASVPTRKPQEIANTQTRGRPSSNNGWLWAIETEDTSGTFSATSASRQIGWAIAPGSQGCSASCSCSTSAYAATTTPAIAASTS